MMLDLFHSSLKRQLNSPKQNQFWKKKENATSNRHKITCTHNEDEQKYEAEQPFMQNDEVALALAV